MIQKLLQKLKHWIFHYNNRYDRSAKIRQTQFFRSLTFSGSGVVSVLSDWKKDNSHHRWVSYSKYPMLSISSFCTSTFSLDNTAPLPYLVFQCMPVVSHRNEELCSIFLIIVGSGALLLGFPEAISSPGWRSPALSSFLHKPCAPVFISLGTLPSTCCSL